MASAVGAADDRKTAGGLQPANPTAANVAAAPFQTGAASFGGGFVAACGFSSSDAALSSDASTSEARSLKKAEPSASAESTIEIDSSSIMEKVDDEAVSSSL